MDRTSAVRPWRAIVRRRRLLAGLVGIVAAALLVASRPRHRLPAVASARAGAPRRDGSRRHRHRRLAGQDVPGRKQQRILYIVTTLAEYNSGTRSTVRGSDRLQETLIPVVAEGIRSMTQAGYQVDLFLVCHFTLQPERRALVEGKLPPGVRLFHWSEATPLGYDTGREPFTKLENRTLHLSRQHRFVIKDHLLDYDLFVCFEDDMLITAQHVQHYVAVTEELERLRRAAPDELPEPRSNRDAAEHYHGVMTKAQLARTLPGWIRVEVLLDEAAYPAQSDTGPVPVDLAFAGGAHREVDASVCCHVSEDHTAQGRPAAPDSDKLVLWETNIMPLGVRKFPEGSWLDWAVLQRGPSQGQLNASAVIGDYWTNRNKRFYKDKSRPMGGEFRYINNQGGWMATRDQLWRWHTEICPGGFLPPYEAPHYRFDGLDMRNVEWYSGAMQLSTIRHACNMQRIILLDPANFSKSLIYHTANNKQKQLRDQGKGEWFVKANTLLGQLNTIRKLAEQEMTPTSVE